MKQSFAEKIARAKGQLQSALEKLVASNDWQTGLKQIAAFHRYSFANMMLIWGQRPEATRVAGFKTWEKLGRRVKKGERGIMIFCPRVKRLGVERAGTTEEETQIYFSTGYVFDISQTEGEDLKIVQPRILEGTFENAAATLQKLEGLAGKHGVAVRYVDRVTADALGMYSHSRKTIEIKSGVDDLQKLKTLAHEIGHMLLHHDEDETAHVGELPRSTKEVEAESCAYLVCAHLGLDTSCYSLPYIAHWAEGDIEVVRQVGDRAAKASRTVIAHLEPDQEGETKNASAPQIENESIKKAA